MQAYALSRNANDQGRFVVVKTRLTTKRKGKCEGRGDYVTVLAECHLFTCYVCAPE
jgi:hypothetical protein